MKHWWQSKTIVASLLTVITIVVGIFAPEIAERLSVESPALVEVIAASAGITTTVIAIFGRIVAKDEIK